MKLETRWVLTGSMAAVLAVGPRKRRRRSGPTVGGDHDGQEGSDALAHHHDTDLPERAGSRAGGPAGVADGEQQELQAPRITSTAIAPTSTGWACSGKGRQYAGHGEVVYDDSTHFHVSTTQQTTAGGRV